MNPKYCKIFSFSLIDKNKSAAHTKYIKQINMHVYIYPLILWSPNAVSLSTSHTNTPRRDPTKIKINLEFKDLINFMLLLTKN